MSLVEPFVQEGGVDPAAQRVRTNKVLLLGNDDRVVLAILRSLGRRGISVHVAWCDEAMPALRSKYVSEVHAIPAYREHSDAWVDALNRLVRSQDYDLVIPCNDYAVVPLQLERQKLDKETNWYLIPDEAFRVAFDKTRTSELARQLGIPMPVEFSLSPEHVDVLTAAADVFEIDHHTIEFPVFVKPRSSITQSDVEHKRSAKEVATAGELAETLQQLEEVDGTLIQEKFAGEGVGVEVLARNGRVLIELQHRRLRETIDGGSTYRETVERNSELSLAVSKLVSHLDYSGVAMFEFRLQRKTMRWVMLEINARFWGSLPLAIAAGIDFPHCLYEMMVGGRREFASQYRSGVRCRNLVADLRAFQKCDKSEGSPEQCFQWANLLLGRDHLDHFAADDWRPQLHSIWQFGSGFLRKCLPGIRK